MNFYVGTDVGVVRSENQDMAAVFQKGEITLAILCDGMGGHSGGKIASKTVIEVFEKEFFSTFPFNTIDINEINRWFSKSISKSKDRMKSKAQLDSSLMDMGTTLTAALINSNNIFVYNLGDSRTYVYNGLFTQVTKDHNLRNYYIDVKKYSQERAAKSVGAMALTRALGPTKKGSVDCFELQSQGIEYLLLTSDGIHDYIPKPVIEKIITSNDDLQSKVNELISTAIKGKSSDNLTAILLEVSK